MFIIWLRIKNKNGFDFKFPPQYLVLASNFLLVKFQLYKQYTSLGWNVSISNLFQHLVLMFVQWLATELFFLCIVFDF